MTKKRHSRLTKNDRIRIQAYLDKGYSIRSIAKDIKKNPSTVLREIRRNTFMEENLGNDCAYFTSCSERHVCGRLDCNAICSKNRMCKKICYKHCTMYEKKDCDKLSRAPHVCNGCVRIRQRTCFYDKYIYKADEAQRRAEYEMHQKNSGHDLTLEEYILIDQIVTDGLRKGQAPYHIWKSNPEIQFISIDTIYRLIDEGELNAKNLDLPEKVRRKPRKTKRRKMHNEVLRKQKIGHMWTDFLDYDNMHRPKRVEMDCIEGKRDEAPAILTLYFKRSGMQLGFLLAKHDSKHVVHALDNIEGILGTELFQDVFPVILTDNGHEFMDIEGMEHSCINPNVKRTRIFFCEPNRADQKGGCENNHKLVRRIIPKGTSLLSYTQEEITLMFNHINSYRRNSRYGACSYELSREYLPADFFDLLGLYTVRDTEVRLTPDLIREYRRRYIKQSESYFNS